MTVSIKVIDRSLRDDFGFKQIMWVYSGRRGVHCWISDKRALKLSNEGRKAVINFLNVIKASSQKARRVRTNNFHPSLE